MILFAQCFNLIAMAKTVTLVLMKTNHCLFSVGQGVMRFGIRKLHMDAG